MLEKVQLLLKSRYKIVEGFSMALFKIILYETDLEEDEKMKFKYNVTPFLLHFLKAFRRKDIRKLGNEIS